MRQSQAKGHWEDLELIKTITYCSLRWWNSNNLLLGRPLPQVTITTNASLTGWGAHLAIMTVQGTWTLLHPSQHINYLELLAIHLALQVFFKLVQGKVVLIKKNNLTTMYNIQ